MACIPAAALAFSVLLTMTAPPSPPAASPAGPSGMRADLATLSWMAGHWAGGEGGDASEEVWLPPSGGAMVGMWRWVSGGKAKLFELITLTQDGPTPVMRLRHFNPDGVGWEEKDQPVRLPLVALSGQEAVFEGPGRGGVRTRITYRRTGDELVSVLDKEGLPRQEFRFRRRADPLR